MVALADSPFPNRLAVPGQPGLSRTDPRLSTSCPSLNDNEGGRIGGGGGGVLAAALAADNAENNNNANYANTPTSSTVGGGKQAR